MSGLTEHDGRSVEAIIRESVPGDADGTKLLFVMGPYRLLDPGYLYEDRTFADLPPDPLAPHDHGHVDVDPDDIETTLRKLCAELSAEPGVTAFIASDVAIPTVREVQEEGAAGPALPVIDQSVAFAAASDACAFVFTKAALTTGVGAEAGAIPEYFGLRRDDPARPPSLCRIFAEAERVESGGRTYLEPRFSSASIDEMDEAYDVPISHFADRRELLTKLIGFVEGDVFELA
ncbi:hypothetical protein BV210_15920 [Halorientalis sp. IM1011]|uniref:DUF7509 family protein n=1 Tax=Halorientalis sp. IM1011 TaxID=1932360 RepID=UPI00097CCEBF|nr:hypothetical protein [Halorientalis sp. IM1011]AQL44100.1 hypothetical protein BV210_15920 [Halorientalis sp. IM1011]